MEITVRKLEEAGYEAAMYGLSLNKNRSALDMGPVAEKLAPNMHGHNKFMESIMIWVAVRAPRYWWQDADTYRLTSKQSQSTNHTIMRRPLNDSDFEDGDISPSQLSLCNSLIKNGEFLRLKKHLPEGFMQEREWRFDYKCFANIVIQRQHHKLPHWPEFIRSLMFQIQHPELFTQIIKIDNG